MFQNKYLLNSVLFILLSLGVSGVTSRFHLVSFINDLFMTGLVFLIFAAAIYVVKGGFFTLFSKSMKKMIKRPEDNLADDGLGDDFDTDDDPDEKGKRETFWRQIKVVCLIAGLFCCLLSFALVHFT